MRGPDYNSNYHIYCYRTQQPSETKGVCEGCDLIVKFRRFQWQEEDKTNESTGGGIVVFVGGNVRGGSATCRMEYDGKREKSRAERGPCTPRGGSRNGKDVAATIINSIKNLYRHRDTAGCVRRGIYSTTRDSEGIPVERAAADGLTGKSFVWVRYLLYYYKTAGRGRESLFI